MNKTQIMLTALVLVASRAYATGERIDTMKTYELQDVQVVSTRANQKTPMAFSTLDKEQIRKLNLTVNHLLPNTENIKKPLRQLDLFTKPEKTEQQTEQNLLLQQATLEIQRRYGKNALLKGTNFRSGATAIERNSQIGGHRA